MYYHLSKFSGCTLEASMIGRPKEEPYQNPNFVIVL
jgi:hypothetical protein